MSIKKITTKNGTCAVVTPDTPVIGSSADAVDVLMDAKYQADTANVAVAKELLSRDFFILSTGLAGEILQKYVNYGGRIAIYGDFSEFTSKPLKDFMYESNQGDQVFFVKDEEEAVSRLIG